VGNGNNQVKVSYLNVGAPGSENISISSSDGLITEMCPKCYVLVPTDLIQQHIDQPHAGEDQTPGWEPGQFTQNRPDQGLPPEQGAPDQGLPPQPGAPDQGLPPTQPPPGEVSGGPPPTAEQH
jgi:hypothetical protein